MKTVTVLALTMLAGCTTPLNQAYVTTPTTTYQRSFEAAKFGPTLVQLASDPDENRAVQRVQQYLQDWIVSLRQTGPGAFSRCTTDRQWSEIHFWHAIGGAAEMMIRENQSAELIARVRQEISTLDKFCPSDRDRNNGLLNNVADLLKPVREQRLAEIQKRKIAEAEAEKSRQAEIERQDLARKEAQERAEQERQQREAKQKLAEEQKRLDAVRGLGIKDIDEYRQALGRMRSMRYSDSDDALADFLRDENAGRKVGQSAIAYRAQIRKANEEAARIKQAREQAEAERQRVIQEKERAKRYPFVARLSCGMGGAQNQNMGLLVCLSHGARPGSTELRLRNGNSALAIYKNYTLGQLGRDRVDGFYIDLEERFQLTVQNGNPDLVLSLKIIDRLSGKVLFDNAATRHEVLSVSN